ncbi:MAG TPA: ADP-ribosylglycohydrolase family protein [Caldithrix abyssi]|uniref:ADP-ribosylglycohydrolase family protein n=2 Tax=Caldithrix abyssi TaxID=187145 RepID=A0A7V1PTG4_CALAY|nr:ADP-ribosylglycohydrolase family protein [Caldithrix abyssi]
MTQTMNNAYLALQGLATGNAFGNTFYKAATRKGLVQRKLPASPWLWTADTAMAVAVCQTLREHGTVDEETLVGHLIRHFEEDTFRNYGNGMFQILTLLSQGQDWKYISPSFAGSGSHGNEAAVRALPVGAWFYEDMNRVQKEAEKAAIVTHFHKEARSGAIAVACACALTLQTDILTADEFLSAVLDLTPPSLLRKRMEQAGNIGREDLPLAIMLLGNGDKAAALDTVPLALWISAHYRYRFKEALWTVATAGGDCDSIGAIVGGISALACGAVPPRWLECREPLKHCALSGNG